jgi:hypothetical protein
MVESTNSRQLSGARAYLSDMARNLLGSLGTHRSNKVIARVKSSVCPALVWLAAGIFRSNFILPGLISDHGGRQEQRSANGRNLS